MVRRLCLRLILWFGGLLTLLTGVTLYGVFGLSHDGLTYLQFAQNVRYSNAALYAHDLSYDIRLSLVNDPDLVVVAYAWSPDGRTLAFIAFTRTDTARTLYLRDETGDVRLLGKVEANGGPYWSPDSRHLVLIHADYLELLDVASSERQTVLLSGEVQLRTDTYVPVADAVALMRGRVPFESRVAVFRVNLYTGEVTEADELPCAAHNPRDLARSPDGLRMVYGCFEDQPLYVSEVRTPANGVPISPLSLLGSVGDETAPAWEPDGDRVIFTHYPTVTDASGLPYDVYLTDIQSRHLQQILPGQGVHQVDWLPPRR
jgi:Tol biopolymer transport system component